MAACVVAYAASTIAILFQVVNIKLFKEMREFLRMDSLLVRGRVTPCPAVTQSVTRKWMILLIVLPILTLGLHAASQCVFPRFWRAAARRVCRPAWIFAAGVTLWMLVPLVRPLVGGEWSEFWRNPHLVFVQSLLERPVQFRGPDADPGLDAVTDPVGTMKLRLARPPKNMIVVVAESMGTGFLESYGGRLPTTPNFAGLRKKL